MGSQAEDDPKKLGLIQQPPDAEASDPKHGSEPKPDKPTGVPHLVAKGVRSLMRQTGKPPTDQEAKQGDGDE